MHPRYRLLAVAALALSAPVHAQPISILPPDTPTVVTDRPAATKPLSAEVEKKARPPRAKPAPALGTVVKPVVQRSPAKAAVRPPAPGRKPPKQEAKSPAPPVPPAAIIPPPPAPPAAPLVAAAPATPPDPVPVPPATPALEDRLAPIIKSYCATNAPKVEEARRAWQMRELAAIEKRLEARIGELVARKADVEAALAAQKERAKQASDGVIALYGKMRPDAAAAQLATMDEPIAVAVLAALEPKVSSLIVNELEPAVAARLTRAMSRVGDTVPGKS